MPKELTWNDADEIGVLLAERYPETDPLGVRLAELRRYVSELPEFKDDASSGNDGKLQAIQSAWHAEVLDRTQG
jgi:FeS assembly protein IscX